ncbi:TRAP transporter substrate-binding protein [Brevibacterium jeotgali]|uniref:TRAP-type C4-dicarboxylate transport system, substrate-binding protein n=1 Tax=Brevibacterium jeotgali TaxID=1262550 RepID=A0A2H1L301_9MICO|nr:TRAP transporter substrate-binding protein [Brevibacterium jeotgali]TWC03072.1 TRAP-type C4-dicarboxylate transport system substrate-binding protein [Brevibacterium jeotgali]SMY11095.1 TRAP-type C4-dicarboxylate transport system, substrate-binding protein [Brevibacterium jeotgali]
MKPITTSQGAARSHAPFASGPLNRRSLLALAAAAPMLAAAGCAPGASANGLRPDGALRVATYITPGYTDLFPGIELFNESLSAELGSDIVDFFDSGALLNAEQLVPGMLRGVTDVGFQTSSYVSASFPILGAAELPFVNDGFEQMRRALAPSSPLMTLMNDTLRPQGITNIGAMPCTEQWLFTVDRPVVEPGDLRGLRIRTAGHVEGEMVKSLGGAPVSMSSAELYEALERGTIDGMVSYLGTIVSRGLEDVVNYATRAHFGAYSVDAYANTAWFGDTGPAVQEALHSAGAVYAQEGTDIQYQVYEEDYLPMVQASSLEIVELDDNQIDSFRDATSGVVDWWIKAVGDTELAEQALAYVKEA